MLDDLVAGCAEHENVVVAYRLVDLYVRPVLCAKCDSAVEHKLHISCAACLLRCERYLLGNIAGRNQFSCFRHVIVFNHDNSEVFVYLRIIVDDLLQAENQVDDVLCDYIRRSRLGAEDRRHRSCRDLSCLDFKIFVNDIERIELLAFVLVQTLHLDVKDRIRAYFNILRLFQVSAQRLFIFMLDLEQLFKHCVIIFIFKKLLKLRGVLLVSLADQAVDILCQERIAVDEPAAECDAVCLVVELLRIDLVEVVQLRVLQNLRVQGCDAVHTESVMNINMRHVYCIVSVDHGNALIIVFSSYLVIQHLDDRHELRNNLLQVSDRPLLKRLCEDCVVRISACPGDNIDCVIHVQSALHEQADQLRDHHSRMRIVNLDHRIVRQVVQSASLCRTLVKNKLGACAHHKILLIDTEQPSLFIAVVRVEEQREILLNIFLIKINSVLHDCLVDRIDIKQMELIRLVVIASDLNVIHSGVYFQSLELYRVSHIRPVQPGFLLDPRVRRFLLEMILKLLLEQSEVIVQPDAVSRKAERSDRIKEACCETSQSSVSERRFRLSLFNLGDVLSVCFQNVFHFFIDAEIDHIVGKKFSDKKLS